MRKPSIYPTLHEIAKHAMAKTAVEIGVRRGWSTARLLTAMQHTGGHLWSVDIRSCGQARRAMAAAGLSEWWTFVQACSWEWGDCPAPLDLVFIDGDHALVRKDWDAFEPRVRPGGLLLLHDYYGGCGKDGCACDQCRGTQELVDTVIRPEWRRWECATLPYDHGLTIVRKR